MALKLLDTKFSVNLDPASLVGTNTVVILPKGIEDPFVVIDENNSVDAGLRTLGANLTTILTTDQYPISQFTGIRRTVNKYTVVTAATAETIAYPQTLDLSTGFFDSAEQPILAFGVILLSGVSAVTPAQRTINVQFTDTAVTPVVFSNGGDVDVDEFDYIMGNADTGNLDLTGWDELVVIPLDKLQASTTKKFNLQVKFNLPVGATFLVYRIGAYRAPEDCSYIRPSSVIIENPKNFSDNPQPNIGKMKGALGNFLGPKVRVSDYTMSFEEDTLVDEHERILFRNKKYNGGKQLSQRVELTIPDTYPYELSTGIPNLGQVATIKDIWAKLRDITGALQDLKIIEGGQYLPQGAARLYLTGTRRLRFSPNDAGKTVIIQSLYTDPDSVVTKMDARGKMIYADVIRIKTDNTDPNSSRRRQALLYKNCTVAITPIGASVDNDETERLKYEIQSISTSPDSIILEKNYQK